MLFRVPRADVASYIEAKIASGKALIERVSKRFDGSAPVGKMLGMLDWLGMGLNPGERQKIVGNMTQKITEEIRVLEFMGRYLESDEHDCVSLSFEEAKFLDFLKPCSCDECRGERSETRDERSEPASAPVESSIADDLDAPSGPFAFKPFDASDLASATPPSRFPPIRMNLAEPSPSIHADAEVLPADMLPAG